MKLEPPDSVERDPETEDVHLFTLETEEKQNVQDNVTSGGSCALSFEPMESAETENQSSTMNDMSHDQENQSEDTCSVSTPDTVVFQG